MTALSKGLLNYLAALSVIFIATSRGEANSKNPAQENASDLIHSITLNVRTDRDKYSPEDWIKVSASLRNNDDDPVYIDRRMFWTGLSGGLKLGITDEHGMPLPAKLFSDAMMGPPSISDRSILVRLDSGFFYGTSVRFKAKNMLPGPGRYSIQVEYKSWLRKEFVAPQLRSLPAIWEEAPEIFSEPVWITLTE